MAAGLPSYTQLEWRQSEKVPLALTSRNLCARPTPASWTASGRRLPVYARNAPAATKRGERPLLASQPRIRGNLVLKIVGDRYTLRERQRIAVARCACSDEARERRQRSQADLLELAGRCLFIDGYNVLTSIEAALAGGVILHARDGAYRDMASVHGTWRKVQETMPAAELIGGLLAELSLARAVWHLDRPVSNSGRLKTILEQTAAAHGWPWESDSSQTPTKSCAKPMNWWRPQTAASSMSAADG